MTATEIAHSDHARLDAPRPPNWFAPATEIDGLTVTAGLDGRIFDPRLVVQITWVGPPDGEGGAADAEAVELEAAVEAEVEKLLPKTPEVAAQRAAAKKLAAARKELADADATLSAARRAYQSAEERDESTLPYAEPLERAEAARAELAKWTAKLVGIHSDAERTVSAARRRLRIEAAERRRAALTAREVALRAFASAAVAQAGDELLRIDRLRKAFARLTK